MPQPRGNKKKTTGGNKKKSAGGGQNKKKAQPKKQATDNESQKEEPTTTTTTTSTSETQSPATDLESVQQSVNKLSVSSHGKTKPKKEESSTSNADKGGVEEEEKKEKTLKDLIFERPNAGRRDPNRVHKFWNNQPMPKMEEQFDETINEAMEKKTLGDVRKQPLLLPSQFEWSEVDLNDGKEVQEVYTLLANHYVEDDDNRFRFNYSPEFLRWALMVPGYRKQWHLGVRVVKTQALCGFITAIPAKVNIYEKTIEMVEINFLCVHKKLRSNRLAPVLIKEITRRVNCTERWQAVYTAGVVLPKPVAKNRYWHRSLNPSKLVDVGFSSMHRRMTKPRLKKLYDLPKETQTPGLRVMTEADCESAQRLLTQYLQKFALCVHFTVEEFKHFFLPRKGVVCAYVIQDKETSEITDFISFYELPSAIMNHPKYNGMKAAYSYYNVVTSVEWHKVMYDALILAKQMEFDVFNALDVMENSTFLEELKFKIGDGNLQYYIYNWKCKEMTPGQVALVLL